MYELRFFQQPLWQNSGLSTRVLHAFMFGGRLIHDVDVITHEPEAFVQQYFYDDQVCHGID